MITPFHLERRGNTFGGRGVLGGQLCAIAYCAQIVGDSWAFCCLGCDCECGCFNVVILVTGKVVICDTFDRLMPISHCLTFDTLQRISPAVFARSPLLKLIAVLVVFFTFADTIHHVPVRGD